jgi:hypothetical protein
MKAFLSLEAHFLGQTSLTAHSLLSTLPRGAYTTARSMCGGTHLLALPTHLSRTRDSAVSMLGLEGLAASQVFPVDAAGSDSALFEARMTASLSALLTGVRGAAAAGAGAAATDYKVTCLLLWGAGRVEQALQLLAPSLHAGGAPLLAPPAQPLPGSGVPSLLISHAMPLLPPRAPPIVCAVRGLPRANATAKDSEWVRAREALEAAMAPGEEEALLLDPASGCITEGTQTNFFAVASDGAVHTAAPEHCLEGTIRAMVLAACAEQGLSLVQGLGPAASQAGSWRGAFLTSTSRLVLPVDELVQPSGQRTQLPSRQDATVLALAAAVQAAAHSSSTRVVAEEGSA